MTRSINGASVIVTGSSGFIGSHLCSRLVKDLGCRVVGIDYMPPRFDLEGGKSTASSIASSSSNSKPFKESDSKEHFSFQATDISNSSQIKNIYSKCDTIDYIFHLAALANPRACKADFDLAFAVNVLGAKNVIVESPKESRIVFMSSAAVYGPMPTTIPIPENHLRNGTDPYAITKIMGEDLCDCYVENYGYNICIGRNFNAFGEGQVTDYIIPTLIKQAVMSSSIEVWNTNPVRDFLYVEDTIDALITLAELGERGRKYNIGSGIGRSIGELINLVKKIVSDDIQVRDLKRQVIGSNKLIADASSLKGLGWSPKIDLEEGLRHTIDWFKSQKTLLATK